ncbi:SusC/RagA family TonB-linked outer membrane protein [Pareuzebyella sediminis]|uniref:SusC/RagA family TonB-linked outer membrane protein n=1 Tax=Pareuzebyella sediminis TaxID=2607998 RepID=UPI0011EFAC79|nr:TonB-dependent receptor [Pareuzebyella sediminis]
MNYQLNLKTRGLSRYRSLLTLFLLLGGVLFSSAWAQSLVTGTVTDQAGAPLPGVSVVVDGTTQGVSTDFDGNYSIDVESPGAILVYSYIGFVTQEIARDGRETIDVEMQEDVQNLDEVVVVGYGTQKKATLTGSVSSVDGEALEKSASPNLGAALAGKVPGLYVDTGQAIPGADTPAIRVRGTNTFNNSGALVVIDGIPAREGGIARINPADIESISVLKDASAAIYGARAANGVILVTTKRGKVGAPTVKFSSTYGLQNFTSKPDMLTGAEYMDLVNVLNVYKLPVSEWNAAHAGRGAPYTRQDNGEVVNPTFTNDRIANTAAGQDPWLYPDTDWMEAVTTKSAPISRQNIQVSGGTENVRYLASLGYLKQEVNFKNAPKGYQQYDLRLNLDATISESLSLDIGLYSRQEDNVRATRDENGIFDDLVRQYPWFPAYWPTGEFGPDIENGNNPAIRVTDGPGYREYGNNFVQSNIGLTFKVPGVEGLQLRGQISYDKANYEYKNWNRPWTLYTWDGINRNSSGLTAAQRGPGDPSLRQEHTTKTDIMAMLNASYEKDFGNHYLKLLGGVTRESTEQQFFGAFKRFFLSSELAQLDLGGTDGQNSYGNGYEAERLNYYGRLNYTFKDKYLLEFLFRYDGSYLFAEGNRFGFFPGISAGWILTEEPFFQKALPFLNYFKLRGSYGQLGNDNVERFQYLNAYQLSQTGLETVVTTAYESNVANPNITWETAISQNIGFDLRTLNNKLSIGLDLFKNSREDILTPPSQTLPEYSGITPPPLNIGEFENKGYEITVGLNGGNENFTYSFSFNLSQSKNKLVFFDEPALDDRPWQLQEGGEIGRPLLYRFDGVFRNQAEIDAETLDYSAVTPELKPGDARVVDISGDGAIGPEDRLRTGGSAFADTQYGFNTSLNYKNIDFSMFWSGQAGGYSNYEWSFMSGTLANVQREVRDRAWSLDNPDAPLPRLADRGDQWYSGQTDGYLITRDFVRLKNLEIGYTFDSGLIQSIGADNLRLSVSGTNLITITDYPFDPEVLQISNSDLSNNGVGQDASTQGVSGGRTANGGIYPMMKTINMGVQITF